MAAMSGVALLVIMFLVGFACMIPAIIGLTGCGIHKRKKEEKAKLSIRVILWIVLAAGIALTAVPALYFYLIISNW